jgi:hypothetical protein
MDEMEKNAEFKLFCQRAHEKQSAQPDASQSLELLIPKPMQKLFNYRLFLERLLKIVPSGTEDFYSFEVTIVIRY